jgi:hypothetical protein
MRKLRRRRCLQLFVVAGAVALVAATPVGALAASEGSSGSTAGETGTESGGGSTVPAPAPPPEEAPSTAAPPASTGWVPQEAGTEVSSHEAAAPTRHGSSLGVGASSNQAKPKREESSYSGGSSDYYEPEPSTPSTAEEPASKPRPVSPVVPVEPQAAKVTPDKGGHVAVAAAISVAMPESPQATDTSSAPAAVVPAASTHDRAASGSGGLPLAVLIVFGLILVYAGVRLLFSPVEPDLFRSGPLQRVRRALSRV